MKNTNRDLPLSHRGKISYWISPQLLWQPGYGARNDCSIVNQHHGKSVRWGKRPPPERRQNDSKSRWATPLFGLYGDVPLGRVWVFGLAVLNRVCKMWIEAKSGNEETTKHQRFNQILRCANYLYSKKSHGSTPLRRVFLQHPLLFKIPVVVFSDTCLSSHQVYNLVLVPVGGR